MIKLTFFATLVFILASTSTAQWILKNPSTTDNDLFSIYSINNYHWSVGEEGTIIFSSDNGASWIEQNSNVNNDLNSVFFVSYNIGWIVGDWGTILRTTNGGTDWELISTTTSLHLKSVFFVTENIGWVAGGNHTYSITLKTTDGGLTWIEQFNNSPIIYSIFFVNDSTGWSLGNNYFNNISVINKTTDGGISWVNNHTVYGQFREIYFKDSDTGFCVGEKVLRTTDGGNNWEIVINGLPYYAEKIKFANENIGWIIYARSAFRTLDGGDNWTEIELPQHTAGNLNYTNYNSISIIDSNTVYVAGNNGTIIKSSDNGVSWGILSGILSDLFDIQFVNSLVGFIGAGDGRIFRTNDGGLSWSSTVTQTTNNVLNLLMISPSIGFATAGNEILKSTNGGQTWLKKSYTPNHQHLTISDIFFIDNTNGWACANYSTIINSSNGGETWQVQLEDNGIAEITSIYFHNEFNGVASGISVGQTGRWSYFLWTTTDGGNNWIPNDLEIASNGLGDSKLLFFNEMNGWLLLSDRLLFTSDGGASWDLKFYANDLLAALDMSIVDENRIWITSWYGAILNSTNGGETWGIQGNYGEHYQKLRSISMFDDQIGWIVGSPNVIYKTINGGQGIIGPPSIPILSFPTNGSLILEYFDFTWSIPEDCLSRLQISTDFDFNTIEFEGFYVNNSVWSHYTCNFERYKEYYWRVRSENQLGVSDWSEIWYFTTDIQPMDVEEEIKLQYYNLFQNYPNPFNPSTNISYQIPQSSFVTLKVYDVLGSKVATLVNEDKPVGNYEVEFNGTGLPSGIYFYQLKADTFVETKKMVLMK